MEDNGNDFDAAAMGLPTGFGAVSKQIPKKQKQAKADVAAFDSTKRSEASQSDQVCLCSSPQTASVELIVLTRPKLPSLQTATRWELPRH